MLDTLLRMRAAVRERAPLVHCLTGHIAINDCANILLAVQAKPIMAEHPRESAEITRGADALALNLGNISDARMQAMRLSAAAAAAQGIPMTLDLVGVACSAFRLEFALDLVRHAQPQILKGNLAEITALREQRTVARGVDARDTDLLAEPRELVQGAATLAGQTGAVVVVSGPVDVVATAQGGWLCRNGHPLLGRLTGTGCMLNALIGAFLAVGSVADAALLAVLLEGVAGERAAQAAAGVGSFRAHFFDAIDTMTDETLAANARLEEMTLQ